MPGLAAGMRRAAEIVAALAMATVFVLFVVGVGMRYLANRPQAWIDEAVTILSVWGTFWTAALVLRWPDHIAFDVVFSTLTEERKRLSLLVGASALGLLLLAALPGMIDYTQFLWRERTDAMQLRLDWVYSIFPAFVIAIVARLGLTLRRLAGGDWRAEVRHWSSNAEDEAR